MSGFDDLPFYDHDPTATEQASEASLARVREGFAKLLDSLQRPLQAAHEARHKKWQVDMHRLNTQMGERDGHVIPEGCSIPVSPALLAVLYPGQQNAGR